MKRLRKITTIVATVATIAIVPVLSAFAASGVVNTAVLNVRSGPSTDYGVVGQVCSGTSVEVLESSNGWYKIGYGSETSYVDGRYISLSSAEDSVAEYYKDNKYGKVTASTLNIRSAASTNSSIVGSVENGASVEIVGKQGGFVIVKYDGQEGFLSENYIEYITKSQYDEATAPAPEPVEEQRVQAAPVAASSTPKPAAVATPKPTQAPAPAPVPMSSTGNAVVDVAMQYIGVPYVYGGTTPSGFDCSGFTRYVYRQLGYSLNRTAAAQASNGTVVASKADLQPGDLLLFRSSSGSGIGHVGIYIGGGNMVHAPKPGSYVKVASINTSYYSTRYVGARRFF